MSGALRLLLAELWPHGAHRCLWPGARSSHRGQASKLWDNLETLRRLRVGRRAAAVAATCPPTEHLLSPHLIGRETEAQALRATGSECTAETWPSWAPHPRLFTTKACA